MRRLLPAFLTVLALSATALPAGAEVLADSTGSSGGSSEGVLTDACRELPEDRDAGANEEGWERLTGEACDTVRIGTWNAADACWTGLREVSSAVQGQACEPLYGQRVSSDEVDAFEGSWVELAHRDQHRWGHALPMRDRTVVATHNSYNALAYDWAFSRMDANQTYSMVDQLRMGVRRLELDVHWFTDTSVPTSAPSSVDRRRPVLCHAQRVAGGTPVTEHIGCSVEFDLATGLAELDAWLDRNRDQFVMLRFENHLGSQEAYDAAAATVTAVLGGDEGHLYTPPAGGCSAFDTSLTAADVLATGTHVMIVSDCGEGTAWRGLAWNDGDVRKEKTYDAAHRDAFRAGRCPRPGSPGSHAPDYPGGDWVRFYNDATWLSSTASRGPNAGPLGGSLPSDATPVDAAAWMRCGVNQPAFDFLTPTDGRMEAMVWSWAEGENLETGRDRCAVLAADGRFHSERCASSWSPSGRAGEVAQGKPFTGDVKPGKTAEPRPYLCRSSAGWHVTTVAGPHAAGAESCAAEFAGSTFAFPRTAREAIAANAARTAAGAAQVWLNLTWSGTTWA